MNLERDLRDAMQGLPADPVADAARVLGALPPGPPPGGPAPRPQPKWLPWTLLAVGLLVGGGIGRLMAPTPASGEPAQGDTPERYPDRSPDQPRQPDQPDQPTQQHQPVKPDPGVPEFESMLQVMAFAPLEIDEPGVGVQQLERGEWRTNAGTLFRTGEAQVGIYLPGNDARARLDRDTVVRIDLGRVQLDYGRIWIDTGDRDASMRVDCGPVRCDLEDAAGSVFTRSPSGVRVLALRGRAVLRTDGQTAVLAESETAFYDVDLGLEAVEKLDFVPPATSWMLPMIEMSSDPRELAMRVEAVVGAYEEGRHRAEARREIIKLGSRCVWQLAYSAERNAARNPGYARETAELISQIVDFRSARYALPLLLLDDAELRDVVFRAVRDRTGTDGGTDAGFWRDASIERRRTVVDRWRDELR